MYISKQFTTTDRDMTIHKLVFEGDGVCVESVACSHEDQDVMCISTQCGCPVGCSFCATPERTKAMIKERRHRKKAAEELHKRKDLERQAKEYKKIVPPLLGRS